MLDIKKVIKKYKINDEDVFLYGNIFAKIRPCFDTKQQNQKIVLVTAISPTPAGEGKTTVSIGLNDALNAIGINSIASLREPSMGPVFGVKGGANGGGKAQIIPKDEINFHFTGDLHAITSANNLISSCLDNNIYWGNSLNVDIKKIIWKRVLDINDRSLRDVEITINAKKNIKYKSGFDITVASEIMAIFCLAKNLNDLQERINKIIVAFDSKNKPIYVSDLGITGAIIKILTNGKAIWPNIVQTLEGNPVLVHGGPFANIAHGCSSIISLNTALNLADYVVTEAGFASDLGAEKFLDIVCDVAKIKPNVIVLVVSIRSLKMHGGIKKNELDVINISALKKGMDNLCRHIKNISAFNIPYIISINQFINDTKQEMDYLQNFFCKNNIPFSFNTAYENGGAKGANDLAKKVVELSKKETSLKPVYKLSDKLVDKIEKICKRCYGATDVKYSDDAFKKIKEFSKFDYYVCMAKTPISLTDDEKILMITKPFTIHVKDLLIANGAKFIIVLTGNIYRMPGLPKIPEANKM